MSAEDKGASIMLLFLGTVVVTVIYNIWTHPPKFLTPRQPLSGTICDEKDLCSSSLSSSPEPSGLDDLIAVVVV